jgi:hypothetical protein
MPDASRFPQLLKNQSGSGGPRKGGACRRRLIGSLVCAANGGAIKSEHQDGSVEKPHHSATILQRRTARSGARRRTARKRSDPYPLRLRGLVCCLFTPGSEHPLGLHLRVALPFSAWIMPSFEFVGVHHFAEVFPDFTWRWQKWFAHLPKFGDRLQIFHGLLVEMFRGLRRRS